MKRKLLIHRFDYGGTPEFINQAVYGNSKQDPFTRMFNDLTGESTKEAVETITNDNFISSATNNDQLMQEWSNMRFYNPLNEDEGLEWKTALSTAMGAPWLDFKNNGVQFSWDNLGASAQGAASGSSFGPIGALVGGIAGGVANLVSRFGRNSRMRKINNAIKQNTAQKIASFNNSASNINLSTQQDLLANYIAFGGDLNSDINNGLISINEGGTHEENPLDGIPMGVDNQGIPNLVEEGEVVFNDYVFSNRLKLSKKELEDNNLPLKYKGKSFAEVAKDLGKESKERPNDPISKNGLEYNLNKLTSIQENQRMKNNKKGTQRLMSKGGRLYSGTADILNKYPLMSEDALYDTDLYKGSVDEALDEAYLLHALSKDPDLQTKLQNIGGSSSKKNTSLRYAPIVGSAFGALKSYLTSPDYSNSNLILDAARNMSRRGVSFKPVGNYLTYTPLDRNYLINKIGSQAGASRRAISNSGMTPSGITAGILASDYNTTNLLGDAFIKMDQYNKGQKQAVEQFNRSTNMFNSEGTMKADMSNALLESNRDKLLLSAVSQAAQMREMSDSALEQSRSLNLTNFFDNLGEVGRENMSANWMDELIKSGYFGSGAGRFSFSKGGKLLTKRRRR